MDTACWRASAFRRERDKPGYLGSARKFNKIRSGRSVGRRQNMGRKIM